MLGLEPEPEPEREQKPAAATAGRLDEDKLERLFQVDPDPDELSCEMYASTMSGCNKDQVVRWFAQRRVRSMRTTHVAPAGSADMRPAAYARETELSIPEKGTGIADALGGAVSGAAKAAISLGNAATQPVFQRAKSGASAMMDMMDNLPRSPLTSERSKRRSREVMDNWRDYLLGDLKWLARRRVVSTQGGDAAHGLTAQVFASTNWESLAREGGTCPIPGVLEGVKLLDQLTLEEEEVVSAGQTCRVYTGRWRRHAEQHAALYDASALQQVTDSGRIIEGRRRVYEPEPEPDIGRGHAVHVPAIPEGIPPAAFASICPGDEADGQPVALKKLYLQCVSEEDLSELSDEDRGWVDDACRQFDSEASLLAKLEHPNVLRIYGVSLGPPSLLCLVLELAQGSLWDLLHTYESVSTPAGGSDAAAQMTASGETASAEEAVPPPASQQQQQQQQQQQLAPLSMQRQLGLAREAATALEFLHTQQPPIAHCDLKSANYLLGRDNLLKLADFGDAMYISSSVTECSHAGTPEWMAPEVMESITESMKCHERREVSTTQGGGEARNGGDLEGDATWSTPFVDRRQSDIYSLGVVLWEIMARIPPLQSMPRLEVMARVMARDTPRAALEEPMPESTPQNYVACCHSCWGSPQFRPMAGEVVEWLKRVAQWELEDHAKQTATKDRLLV
jgi:serine/threonine protein kinase